MRLIQSRGEEEILRQFGQKTSTVYDPMGHFRIFGIGGEDMCKCKIVTRHKAEIENYCAGRKISAAKIFNASMSWDKTSVYILGSGDPERGKLGMHDNVPLPVLLEIYLENGKLRFVQTEHTHQLRNDYATAPQEPHAEIGKLAFA
jgi:hypothetical protein